MLQVSWFGSIDISRLHKIRLTMLTVKRVTECHGPNGLDVTAVTMSIISHVPGVSVTVKTLQYHDEMVTLFETVSGEVQWCFRYLTAKASPVPHFSS